MKSRSARDAGIVDQLIDAIIKKLQANRQVLERSVGYGRLSWRTNKRSGKIEVDLEPKL